MFWLGVLAAVLSPLMMTIGFIVWDQTWKGSAIALNIFKCALATCMFLITILIIGHSSTAAYLSTGCGMLILSSLLGIVIGDVAWLQALQLLGARRVILVDSIKPFLASILGYIILDESVSATGCVGMFVTITGVVIVSLESVHEEPDATNATDKNNDDTVKDVAPRNSSTASYFAVGHTELGDQDIAISPMHVDYKNQLETVNSDSSSHSTADKSRSNSSSEILLRGYSFALMNVMFDAYGAVLTKQFGIIFTASEINLIRFGFAGLFLGALASSFKAYYILLSQRSINNEIALATCPSSVLRSARSGDLIVGEEALHTDDVVVPNSCDEPVIGSEVNSSPLQWYNFPTMVLNDWIKIAAGVLFVTYICPSLFNYALFKLKLGLCLTLTSLGPIFSIPLVFVMKNERTSLRATGGSLISFVGVAMLCFSGG